jgi:hypothetical protein
MSPLCEASSLKGRSLGVSLKGATFFFLEDFLSGKT